MLYIKSLFLHVVDGVEGNDKQHALRAFMGWLWLVGSLKLWVSFAKEPYKKEDILQKRPVILMSLLIVATPYVFVSTVYVRMYVYIYLYVHVYVFTDVCAYRMA